CARSQPRGLSFYTGAATSALSTLSLHDALPICRDVEERDLVRAGGVVAARELDRVARVAQVGEVDALDDATGVDVEARDDADGRSEEHTSELQSRENLVCRLLLEKKKNNNTLDG